MRGSVAALLFGLAVPLAGQTEAVVGGLIADSSIAAPVVSWNRVSAYGDTLSIAVNGWTMSAEMTRRLTPRRRRAASLSITPLRAHSSDQIYVDGERRPDLEFDDTSIELTFGSVDTLGERWTSDIRIVGLYERLEGSDAETRSFWSAPYVGVRTRQSYRHITAEDPLLLTFEGSEVRGDAELFVGQEAWLRLALAQRFHRRVGRVSAGESVVAFHGRSLNTVNAFLAGGSWPLADLQPLYGHRYAELRLDRGVAVNGDVHYVLRRNVTLAVHGSILRSRDIDARGVAVDVSGAWRGVGVRVGVGRGDDRVVVYGSILAARFVR